MKNIEIIMDGFRLVFNDVIDAFIFDEKDSAKSTFHGVPMKCVDIIVENEKYYYFIELKNLSKTILSSKNIQSNTSQENNEKQTSKTEKGEYRNRLKNSIIYKFRDTFLYRYAEDKVDKPIKYICFWSPDKALNFKFWQSVQHELPVGRVSNRWVKDIAVACFIINWKTCQKYFPKWRITLCNSQE